MSSRSTTTALTSTTPMGPQDVVARRGLVIFLIAVVALSAPLEAGIIVTDALDDIGTALLWLAGLMSVPTVASVVARRWLREGFADLAFRRGHDVLGTIATAAILPVVVCTVAYGTGWLSGLVGMRALPVGLWAALLAAMLIVNLVLSTGEELGWRGYLLPHLVAAGVPRPILVSSLIWGGWHVPLFLWGGLVHDGPSPLVTTALMLVTTTSLGYILGRMRLDTGNVWPAAVLHIAWNTIIQTGFDPATTGPDRALWTGESGLLTIANLIAAALLYRLWSRRRSSERP